jgi:hypothetical protein
MDYKKFAILKDNTLADISHMLPFINRGVRYDYLEKIIYTTDDPNDLIKKQNEFKTNEFRIKLDLMIEELNRDLMECENNTMQEARAYGRLSQARAIKEMYEEVYGIKTSNI